MPGRTLDARKRRVFNSVFGGVGNHTQPTPDATPILGYPAPGQSFAAGQFNQPNKFSSPLSHDRRGNTSRPSFGSRDHENDQVRWDRSWHTVTHTLILPDFTENRGILESLKPDSVGDEFYNALEDVLYPQICVPYATQTEDLLLWHTSQVRQHFLKQVLPAVLRARQLANPASRVHRSIKVLETAHRQYLHGLSFIKEQIEQSSPGTSTPVVTKFIRDLHAVIGNSVMGPLSENLLLVLKGQITAILGLADPSSSITEEGDESERARREMLGLVEAIKNVGLAGEGFQVIFAEIMNDAMTEYVQTGCKGLWTSEDTVDQNPSTGSRLPREVHIASPSECVTKLRDWIENRYAKLVVQTLDLLNGRNIVSWENREKYKEMGIGRLAELRTNELFEVVGKWPNGTGALDDLRTSITTPQRRLHLTEVFAQTLGHKLLHPGTSTLQILQTYISMIWSFHALDHSKVLLDRVAFPLQLYLCSREDTVRIVISGLLSDVRDQKGKLIKPPEGRLYELAQILTDPVKEAGHKFTDGDLDWHDMDWVPDPVDAGPGYKRSKNADIIGTLIGVLGSQDVFIKEFQHIISESMIDSNNTSDLKKEEQVLELLIDRFGESLLQACQVMMKDIGDSHALDKSIRQDPRLGTSSPRMNTVFTNTSSQSTEKPGLHAKILSRFFWPQLQDDSFRIPEPVAALQQVYAEGFENQKANRKLTWLQALGKVSVELEFEDRTVKENVHTWQATVIYAFHSEAIGQTVQRTVDDLVTMLEMDEELVRSALGFWADKLVLHESSPSTFTVLETLDKVDMQRAKATSSSTSAATSSGKGGGDAGGKAKGMSGPKEGMYWQFLQGMLKNAPGGMPIAQMVMMLKMLIAEGFPYGNEDLKGFLDGKVQEGKLEVKGGKYKVKK